MLKASDILVLNEKYLKHDKSICYKSIFIHLKIFDSMHSLCPKSGLLKRPQGTLSHLFDIKGTNSITHNCRYKANYRWCGKSMKGQLMFFTWTPCWRVPLSALLCNQSASEFSAIFSFLANLFSFQFNFLLLLYQIRQHHKSTKLEYFFRENKMKNVCTMSDIVDPKQSKATKVSLKTCWVSSTLRRWSSGQCLPLRANSRQERTWT